MNNSAPVRIIDNEVPATFSSGSIQQLLQNIDRLKPQFLPLPDHFAKNCDAHTKERYATLLAAITMADGEVTDNEARLFYLLLGSLGLDKMPTVFFEQAHSLNLESLGDFFRAAKEANLAKTFILDAILLSRIDGTLSEPAAAILGEIAEILEMEANDLSDLSALACHILGINNSTPIPFNWDHGFYEMWHQFLYKKVTMQNLLDGIDYGTGIPNFNAEATAALTATIIDEKTGLMWMRCPVGQTWNGITCIGEAEGLKWDEANNIHNRFNRDQYAGFNDWRLPDSIELVTLVMKEVEAGLKINQKAFPGTYRIDFWTSSESYSSSVKKSIDFGGGYESCQDKKYKYCVRLVRSTR